MHIYNFSIYFLQKLCLIICKYVKNYMIVFFLFKGNLSNLFYLDICEVYWPHHCLLTPYPRKFSMFSWVEFSASRILKHNLVSCCGRIIYLYIIIIQIIIQIQNLIIYICILTYIRYSISLLFTGPATSKVSP